MSCVSRSATFVGVMLAVALFSVEALASDPALARSVKDADLEWGPCPAFFPTECQMAVLHGDASQPNADVFFQLPAEQDFPSHVHTSVERMILITGELHVTYAGQQPVVLKPGMYAYGPPGAPHWGRCVSAENCVLFIAFEEPIDATEIAKESERR